VVVSLGPPPVSVPNLAGLSVSDATNRLIGAGLKLGTVSGRYDNSAKGTVLAWTGDGGQLPDGSAVDVVISNGPPVVTIPTLGPVGFASAQATLSGLNLKAVENDEYSTTVPKGQVISTSPAPGASEPVGTTVTVNVSLGPHLVAVPDVHGQSVDAATAALQAVGFNVSGVTGNPTAPVTRTAPAAGTQALFGSSVTLVTG
jgi:serine/threonine-protein kinase